MDPSQSHIEGALVKNFLRLLSNVPMLNAATCATLSQKLSAPSSSTPPEEIYRALKEIYDTAVLHEVPICEIYSDDENLVALRTLAEHHDHVPGYQDIIEILDRIDKYEGESIQGWAFDRTLDPYRRAGMQIGESLGLEYISSPEDGESFGFNLGPLLCDPGYRQTNDPENARGFLEDKIFTFLNGNGHWDVDECKPRGIKKFTIDHNGEVRFY